MDEEFEVQEAVDLPIQESQYVQQSKEADLLGESDNVEVPVVQDLEFITGAIVNESTNTPRKSSDLRRLSELPPLPVNVSSEDQSGADSVTPRKQSLSGTVASDFTPRRSLEPRVLEPTEPAPAGPRSHMSSLQSILSSLPESIRQSLDLSGLKAASSARASLDAASQPSITTPNPASKAPKYSEEEIAEIRRQLSEQAARDQQALLQQVASLDERCLREVRRREELQKVMDEYESTIAKVIEKTARMKEEDHHKYEALSVEKVKIEKDAMKLQEAFRDVHQRYEDLKILSEAYKKSEEAVKQTLSTCQEDLIKSERRYQALKAHAEEKIEMFVSSF